MKAFIVDSVRTHVGRYGGALAQTRPDDLAAATLRAIIERSGVKAEYIDELRSLQVDSITDPERYFLIAAKGDELLDWKEMAAFYPGAKQLILEGSDHGISDYVNHLPAVIDFIEH